MKTGDYSPVYLYSKHPLVVQTIAQILPECCSSVCSVPRRAFPEGASAPILIVDVCSVNEWREAVGEWVQKREGQSIILAPFEWDSEEQVHALYLGVTGIVTFSLTLSGDILRALTAISKGLLWVNRAVLAKYVEKTCPWRREKIGDFTIREEQTIELMSKGLSNRTIADVLRISERTVKFHVSNILQKHDVNNRKELLMKLCANEVRVEIPGLDHLDKKLAKGRSARAGT